jgi:small subunit ribosomal protein S4e
MSHIKRLAAPKKWPIGRKKEKFIVRPLPGTHSFKNSISLNTLLKDLLQYAKIRREVKEILNRKNILVDFKRRKSEKFLVGIMDVINVKELNEFYRLLYNEKGKFFLNKISVEEAKIKPCKIIRKTILKGGKIQINLYDSKTILVNKGDYKVGDSVILDLEKNKIKDHLKFEKGVIVYLVGGKYLGNTAVVENIQGSDVFLVMGDKKYKTKKGHCFVIGKNKPVINLGK